MKKYIMIAVLALTGLAAHAEAGDISIGGQMMFASKHSLFGLGTQVQIEPVRNFRFAPEAAYYFKNDDVSAYNVNVNLHYLIHTGGSCTIYPLAGFTFAHFKYDDWSYRGHEDGGEDCYGANIGIGFDYRIQQHLAFYTEQRFQIMSDHNQSVSMLGIKYIF